MNEKLGYAQILRTVGQMLEGLAIQSFVLKIEDNDFTVSTRQSPRRQEKCLRVFWQRLRGKSANPRHDPSSGVLELRYTAAEIARMNSEGRVKRGPTAGTPEAHSLSQVLRAVGAFVDQKGGVLETVRKDDQKIEFKYTSVLKTTTMQQFTLATLYDYWVKMYLRRSTRGRM
jgi:hypothetical protein